MKGSKKKKKKGSSVPKASIEEKQIYILQQRLEYGTKRIEELQDMRHALNKEFGTSPASTGRAISATNREEFTVMQYQLDRSQEQIKELLEQLTEAQKFNISLQEGSVT